MKVLAFLLSFWLASNSFAQAGNSATYRVVKSKDRTSGIVSGGQLALQINQRSNGSYLAHMDYKVKVRFYGTFTGRESMSLPKQYFTKEFLQQLRKTKIFVGDNFKVKHLGFGTGVDYSGRKYENCDRLYFYDIDSGSAHYFRAYSRSQFKRVFNEIKDPKILAHVKYGLPVLGAVQLDMKGSFVGLTAKIGADLSR